MFASGIIINDESFTASGIMQWYMNNPDTYVKSGLDFIMQLMDPSPAPVAFITSGTTGEPRGIKFTKQQIYASAMNTCQYFQLNEKSRLLLCLPAEFVAGRMMIARAMALNANLVWEKPGLNPLMHKVNADFAAFTPAQVSEIISQVDSEIQFMNIPTILIGGGEISASLENRLLKYSNKIFATYGMTETLTHIAVREVGTNEYKVIYKNIKLEVDENQCLRIKFPYLQPEFIQTRDIVEIRSDSSFRFLGRIDNVINSGGIKISAETIERIVIENEILKEGTFYVTAAKDEVFGEVPVLVMIKSASTRKNLMETINGLLNKHHSVKRIVLIDKFEYTPTGKIIRQRINE